VGKTLETGLVGALAGCSGFPTIVTSGLILILILVLTLRRSGVGGVPDLTLGDPPWGGGEVGNTVDATEPRIPGGSGNVPRVRTGDSACTLGGGAVPVMYGRYLAGVLNRRLT
jgi:hypothetical protein